jgi:CubicO group peptidase (beta-lactamase class C family)
MSVSYVGEETKVTGQDLPGIDPAALTARVAEILDRWPCAGLAVGVVSNDSLAWFLGHGVANVKVREPVTQDTVFRIGSITKTFTAIAVMQLWERGLVDLDAPVSDYVRSIRLIPAMASFHPVTVRHLLTHTAGIGYWRRLPDLLRPGVGSGNRAGRSGAPPLAEYYRKGLPVEVEPGTKWTYSNHGFAVLGQIVEDVTGRPLSGYLRDNVFEPLEMDHTDLTRSGRVYSRLATGYVLRPAGLKPVADREIPAPGGGAMYSTTADMARYLIALLHGGTTAHGSVLKPGTLASMFQPQFQPDPRLPGMGLGFELGEQGGHKTIGKTGIVAGFHSAMVLAPDDRIGVVVLTNTGGLDGRGAAASVAPAVLRCVLGLPDQTIRAGIPARPDAWAELCGWYSPDPGPVTNLFTRALFGAGVEVAVRDGHLTLKPLTPIPAIRRGIRLYPDDPDDPRVFRGEAPEFGMSLPVVFSGGPSRGAATRLLIDLMSFRKRPDAANPRRWASGVAATGALALTLAIAIAIRRSRQHCP